MPSALERTVRVRRTTPPPESVVAGWYENASLLDSYSIDLSSSKQYSMRVLATRTVGDPPAWIKALVAVRDAMVTPFGVKTSGEVRASRADNEPWTSSRCNGKATTRLCWVRMIDTWTSDYRCSVAILQPARSSSRQPSCTPTMPSASPIST